MRYASAMQRAIVLIGFMGAGKTTVGRELALLTGWPLQETDSMIPARAGVSIAEIFAARGEEAFRAAESEALAKLPTKRAIIATGGGIVLRPANVAMLKRLGTVVYLEADEATLLDRVSQDGESRPLLQTDNPRAALARLLAGREPLYRAAADFTVNTTRLSAAEVAQTIVRYVG